MRGGGPGAGARRRPRRPRRRRCPPWASATCLTIARPRPDPGSPRAAAGAVEAVEDVRQVLRGDAGAVVAHGHLAPGDRDLHRLPGRAPLDRVVEQVADRPRQAAARAADHARLAGQHEPGRGRVAARALHGVVHELIETQVLGRLVGGLAGACEVDEVADEDREIVELTTTEDSDIGALGRG